MLTLTFLNNLAKKGVINLLISEERHRKCVYVWKSSTTNIKRYQWRRITRTLRDAGFVYQRLGGGWRAYYRRNRKWYSL